jgi:hypothetical protein
MHYSKTYMYMYVQSVIRNKEDFLNPDVQLTQRDQAAK